MSARGVFFFSPVEEPERHRQGDRVEHVRPDGDHDVHRAVFNELPAEFLLRGAGIGGRIGHDEASSTTVVQRRVEELNPQVVRVVGARQAEWEARPLPASLQAVPCPRR